VATLSLWDIGNCNCGCACVPCALPATNLHVAYHNTTTGVSDSAVLVFSPVCTWQCTLPVTGIHVTMSCTNTGCSAFSVGTGGSISNYWDNPAHCSGIAATRFPNPTFTCSPLNIVFVNGTVSYTVTL
jgi:hypothetical protein